MKITNVTSTHVNFIETEWGRYLRVGPAEWYVFEEVEWVMVVHQESVLEKAYQEYTLASISK